MENAYLSLGSNLGNRKKYLYDAIDLIQNRAGEVIKKSSIIETEAWGFDGNPFLNQVILISTKLSPFELLKVTKEIEIILGRTSKSTIREGRPVYGNRTIDIDILEYGDIQLDTQDLVLPHPKMLDRDFVMIPYLEIKNEKTK